MLYMIHPFILNDKVGSKGYTKIEKNLSSKKKYPYQAGIYL